MLFSIRDSLAHTVHIVRFGETVLPLRCSLLLTVAIRAMLILCWSLLASITSSASIAVMTLRQFRRKLSGVLVVAVIVAILLVSHWRTMIHLI